MILRHLVESTLFCLMMGALAYCLRPRHSSSRYALWLIGVSKFALPAFLLKSAGEKLAFVFPAPAWLSFAAVKFSVLLAAVFSFLPSHLGRTEIVATHSILFSVWIGVSVLLIGRWLLQLRHQELQIVRPNALERYALIRASRRLAISRPPRIYASASGFGPGLHGLFRQRLIVPRGLSRELEPEEFESVLLHELAHASRCDNLAAAFVHGLVCLFWFHPLLWYAEKRISAERERACDQAVIQAGIAAEAYVIGIAKACRFELMGSIAGVSRITPSDLPSRLHLIRSYRRPHKALRYVPHAVLAGFTILITVLPVAGGYCEQCVSIVQTPTQHLHKP